MIKFFNLKQKRLALKTSTSNLQQAYSLSEARLRDAAKTGDARKLKEAMTEHGLYEYALLYKATPQYKQKIKRRGKGA